MNSLSIWTTSIRDKNDEPQVIWDVSYNNNGTQLLVAAGCLVLVYGAQDGELQKSLKGHKNIVYCVDWSNDNCYFASGAADRYVIIWKASNFEGVLKYRHNEPIQCLCFNPGTFLLASCSCSDFAYWTLEQESVTRTKLGVKPTCCSWKSDGQYLAIGMYNGTISIRNKLADELVKIERPGNPIIWKIRWSHVDKEQKELLAVVDWNQKLSFYQLSGKQVLYGNGQASHQLTLTPKNGKDRNLSFDPSDITWIGMKAEAVAVCGSDQACTLFSVEGSRLAQVSKQSSWIMSCQARPGTNQLVLGCKDGTLDTIELLLPTVHSLYQDRYAFRESLTDVVVQHLITQQKARIKCRDYVKKIAIYKRRLAIQLSDKILIYEPSGEDPTDMHYRVREKLCQDIDCQLLVVTAHHLVVCQENKLVGLNFQGIKEREWVLDDAVRYIRITGGPPTRETLLVGLKNGQAVKVILDNPFPVPLVKLLTGVRCLDWSRNHDKLGLVDDNGTMSVFCLRTKERLFQETGVASLAWSITNNDLISFSKTDQLFIKAGTFPAYSQLVKGVTVGFSGPFVYCLHENTITRVEVSFAPAMYFYLEAGCLEHARMVAAHGLTVPDWIALGQAALKRLNLKVAKYAYIHLKDVLMLMFIEQLEERRQRGEWNETDSPESPGIVNAMGDVSAYIGNFTEAASIYAKLGSDLKSTQRIVDMYTDLRQFDEARKALGSSEDVSGRKQLISKHAEWAKSTNEYHTAAKMYMEAGEYREAIQLAGENSWVDLLLDISRKLDKADQTNLKHCAQWLTRLGEYAFAAECYAKYGDYENQLLVNVEAKNWEEAFSISKQHPECLNLVYLPYAHWLAENDRFEDAQAAFAKAGHQKEAFRVLELLAVCAANESRFEDASFYNWKLSMQCLEKYKNTNDNREKHVLLNTFHEFQRKADVYFVYAGIHRYLHEPFAPQMTTTYFNQARFLASVLQNEEVPAVSRASVLYALARHGQALGAYKLTRFVYEQLRSLRLPTKWREAVESGSLNIRAKPMVDSEDVNIICYRCSTTNPLLGSAGNRCINCGQPFVFSFISLEQLPLVEFVPEKGISFEQAMEYLKTDSTSEKLTKNSKLKSNKPASGTNSDVSKAPHDLFTSKLLSAELNVGPYSPVTLDAETLLSLSPSEVIVVKHEEPLKPRYFKSVFPEVNITECRVCHKLFNTDDYELAVLEKGHCPFCRTPRD